MAQEDRLPAAVGGGRACRGRPLAAAGLGVLGFIVPTDWWRTLAIAGGAISLFMLVVYLHPLMILGTGLSIAILVALLWFHWPPTSLVQ